jgi:hypothetical protein
VRSHSKEGKSTMSSLNEFGRPLSQTEFTTKPLYHNYSTRLPYWLYRNQDLSVIDQIMRSAADHSDISTELFPYIATDLKELCRN